MSKNRAIRDRAERRSAARARRRRHLAWAGSGERCATCAYRPGTEASGDAVDQGLTRLRLALLDAAMPFFCHEEGPTPERRLCVGHMDALSKRTVTGYYEEHPPSAPEVIGEVEAAHAERERLFAEAGG